MSNKAKPLQIGLKFSRSSSDDTALYDLLQSYGRGNIKLHLHRAINLYESCRRTDNVDSAIYILKNDYPHVVSELHSDHNRAIERRIEAIEKNMAQQATKDDINNAVEDLSAKMEMLATQQSVDALQAVAVDILTLYWEATHGITSRKGLLSDTKLLSEVVISEQKQ